MKNRKWLFVVLIVLLAASATAKILQLCSDAEASGESYIVQARISGKATDGNGTAMVAQVVITNLETDGKTRINTDLLGVFDLDRKSVV